MTQVATKSLSVEAIAALGTHHGLQVSMRYPACTLPPGELPKADTIFVAFSQVNADVWELLMSSQTDVPVELSGTRQVSGNGAIDGRLFPEYAQRLNAVNKARNALGLSVVYG